MYKEDKSLRTVSSDGWIDYHCVKLVPETFCEYLNSWQNRMDDYYKDLANIDFKKTYRIVTFDCHYGYAVGSDPECRFIKIDLSNSFGWIPPDCLRNLTPEEIEFDENIKKYNL